MSLEWKSRVDEFISLAGKYEVKMLMVGGGAVNFHGYQRHSSDVDFWIETTTVNLAKLIEVFRQMGYDIQEFPEDVAQQKQNISVKFSPEDLDIELITRFEIGKSFDQAFEEANEVEINKEKILKWRVINYADLLESKRRAARPKDLLDIEQLKAIKGAK